MATFASSIRTDIAGLPALLASGLGSDDSGTLTPGPIMVEISDEIPDEALAQAAAAARRSLFVVIGVSVRPLGPRFDDFGEALALTLVPVEYERARWQVGVRDVHASADALAVSMTGWPVAAATLASLLRLTSTSSVADGLVAESLAYSTLMAGNEYRSWLAAQEPPTISRSDEAAAVMLDREGALLRVTLNRPIRQNAFNRWMRDGLVEAFDLVNLDDSVERVLLTGKGRSFCIGGDLEEFGIVRDLAAAHLIRQDRSVVSRIDSCSDRVTAVLHGAAIGAGIEIASFAGRVIARPRTLIRLPELSMGLIPGAGGTVGVTRRIGRWRTAYVAGTGAWLPLEVARRWRLVDAVEDADD